MVRILLIWIILISNCNCLELKRVILSTDQNPFYTEFWPIVAPIWNEMGFKPTLALIAENDADIDTSLGDVIRFSPLPDIPHSLQAQTIRLLLPILFPDEGCLISDIDMIPISRNYFLDGAAVCPEDGFLVYRDRAEGCIGSRYPMCYVAAKGSVFASLFQISNRDQIPQLIHLWANRGYGWNTDELILYSSVNQWEKRGGHVVRLGHETFGRLDRGNWKIDFESLDLSQYIDCHCPRPYSAYRDSIDLLVNQVLKSLVPNNE